MQYWGYIEGYYGKVLTNSERESIIDTLSEQGLNSYLVASKEDIYHRLKWRTTPPDSYFNSLKKLIEYGKKRDVSVIPAIAPGLSFDYSKSTDTSILIERINKFRELGAENVALLMDDISVDIPENSAELYRSLGHCHNSLLSSIINKCNLSSILFCPTIYATEMINFSGKNREYLLDLANNFPKEATLLWTGESIISETISKENLNDVYKLFGDNIVIWDNYYANDYTPQRIFLGHYLQRDQNYLTQNSSGVMINCTGLPITDKFLISLFSLWKRGNELSTDSWWKIAKLYEIPYSFIEYLPWFTSPFTPNNRQKLDDISKNPLKFFDDIIVDWQNSLKLEWYSPLHRFFTELKIISTIGINSSNWYSMRFLPKTAKILEDSIVTPKSEKESLL